MPTSTTAASVPGTPASRSNVVNTASLNIIAAAETGGHARANFQNFVAHLPNPDYVGPIIHIFTGPQGVRLADFVEKFCPLTNEAHLKRLRLPINSKGFTIPEKFKQYVELLDTGIEGHLRSERGGCVQDYTQCYVLSPLGQNAMAHGMRETIILSIKLACAGSFHYGHDGASGSNCQKNNDHDSSWCSELGTCLTTCGYQLMLTEHSKQCHASGMLYRFFFSPFT